MMCRIAWYCGIVEEALLQRRRRREEKEATYHLKIIISCFHHTKFNHTCQNEP